MSDEFRDALQRIANVSGGVEKLEDDQAMDDTDLLSWVFRFSTGVLAKADHDAGGR